MIMVMVLFRRRHHQCLLRLRRGVLPLPPPPVQPRPQLRPRLLPQPPLLSRVTVIRPRHPLPCRLPVLRRPAQVPRRVLQLGLRLPPLQLPRLHLKLRHRTFRMRCHVTRSTDYLIYRTTSTSSTTSTRISPNTLKVTALPSSTTHTSTTLIIQTNIYGLTSSSASASDVPLQTASDLTGGASKNNSFFKNTGAVAGTFTVVGILAVAAISAFFIIWRKRRADNEEQDIFNTEYKEYNAGGHGQRGGSGDYIVSGNDMSGLSANSASIAGAHYGGEYNYGHEMDYGLGLPPTVGMQSNRSSTVSNHAGYGAYQNEKSTRQPPMQSSGLRNEAAWNPEDAYGEPAVEEDQSIYVVSSTHGDSEDPFHDSHQNRSVGSVGTAH